MKKQILFILGIALVASSCSTVQYTSKTVPVATQIQTLTVADVKVEPSRQETTMNWSWTPFSTFSLSAVKEAATHKLLKETKGDLLIEPQVEVKRRGLFRGGSINISGYPATYANFRSMTKEDAEIIATYEGRIAPVIVCNAANPSVTGGRKQPNIKRKSPKDRGLFDKPRTYHNFISITGGPLSYDDGDECGYHLSLMYGYIWKKWGVYAKLSFTDACHSEGWGDDESESAIGTIGVIKTLPKGWNVFAGAGAGTAYRIRYHNWNLIAEPAFAWDFGFQWQKNRIALSAGITALHNTDANNFNPFVGIGFRF